MTNSKKPDPPEPVRETLPDGSVQITDGRCTFQFKRLRPGAMLVQIHGFDFGGLGDGPLDEVTAEMNRYPPLELFIDAGDVKGAVQTVIDAWTAWLKSNQTRLERVVILVGDRYMSQTMAVAKLFSRTGELILILSDSVRFEALVTKASKGTKR